MIYSSQENKQKPFFTKVTLVTLNFDIKNTKSIGVKPALVNPKLIQFMFLPRPISKWNMKALWLIDLKITSRKHFFTKVTPCDLDLWPSEPKINRVLVLTIINQYVKYESSVITSFQDNDQKPFGLPTDGWTDRPFDISKTICPLFFERGQKNTDNLKRMLEKGKHSSLVVLLLGPNVF